MVPEFVRVMLVTAGLIITLYWLGLTSLLCWGHMVKYDADSNIEFFGEMFRFYPTALLVSGMIVALWTYAHVGGLLRSLLNWTRRRNAS